MTPKNLTRLFCISFLLHLVAACDGPDADTSAADTENEVQPATANAKSPGNNAVTTGRPTAPISFRYEVQGTPIVGQPVSINVYVSSSETNAPITLFYRVNDATSMHFPESQALQAQFELDPGDEPQLQQVTVVPQREGRLYLNVSAEIETDRGIMLKTTSIPVQVGSAPPELETSGDLTETAEGEKVISMPASQSN